MTQVPHERVQLRTAARRHRCWSWSEACRPPGDGYDDNPPCTRMIDVGERHVISTIYPGHESGFADAGWKYVAGVRVEVPARPVSSRFCLPCASRWVNLKRGLDALAEPTGVTR